MKYPRVLQVLTHSPGTMVGVTLVVVHVIATLFAPLLIPFEVTKIVGPVLSSPGSVEHWLGTDNIGRDYLSRLLMGGRTSIFVAMVAITFAIMFASLIAISAAYVGGIYDDVVMRIVDTKLAIPGILFIALIVTGFGRSILALIVAISLSYLPGAIRIIRSHALTIIPLGFVETAKLRGDSLYRIIWNELVPNCQEIIAVEFALRMSSSILTVSALSFLGLGISPPTPDWGLMISEGVKNIHTHTWLVLLPAAFISSLVIGLNLASDGLANALGLDAARGIN
ncbi:MAG: ABC transporter permease [SAR202 cluster bacterium]|nr:ABC transporter permease [SAR202 cluster bacterium]|tara:strand:- start:842 stop:1687 length:846 start_codon:yes stop_codon:yes gene_type:complete